MPKAPKPRPPPLTPEQEEAKRREHSARIAHAAKVIAELRPGIVAQLTVPALEAFCKDIASGTITLTGAIGKHFGVTRKAFLSQLAPAPALYDRLIAGGSLTEKEMLVIQVWHAVNFAEGKREQALTMIALAQRKYCAGADVDPKIASLAALQILRLTRPGWRDAAPAEEAPAPPPAPTRPEPSDADLIAYAHRRGLRLVPDAADGYDADSAAPGNRPPTE